MSHREPVISSAASAPLVSWDDVRGHLSFRTLFGGDDGPTAFASAGITYLDTGEWLGRHQHSAGEMYLIIAGNGVVTLDGTDHDVTAEQAVFVPGGVEHGIRNVGSDRLRFFYVFDVENFAGVVYQFPKS